MPAPTTPLPAARPAGARAAATTDLLVVGSGIMGAVVSRLVREAAPHTRTTVVDGGRPLGATPGTHLHDVVEPELWEQYNGRVASGIQGFYTAVAPPLSAATDAAGLEPGMHLLAGLHHESSAMPTAAAAWNVGGMGVHWTAAVPWPAGQEVFAFGDPTSFADDLATAQRVLGARSPAIGPTRPGRVVLDVLAARYGHAGPPQRAPQPMPMAVQPTSQPTGHRGGPHLRRTSPATIHPPIGGAPDEGFQLLAGHLATALVHDGRRVRGAVVRDTATGEERLVEAAVTVVCADPFRTPQLLHASGIRPPALGRYLNEHAFVTGRVLMDLERFGLTLDELPLAADGEFATDSLWLPHNGPAQPFHGQVMDTTYVDDAGRPLAHSVGLSFYAAVESRPENRLRFLDGELDVTGMPRFAVDFSWSQADRAGIEAACEQMRLASEDFGAFDPATEQAVLPAGSSLHVTGTARMGEHDDGESVCDTSARAWGFENLLLAGGAVVPTAVVANTTLTAAVTAVRAARTAAALLTSDRPTRKALL